MAGTSPGLTQEIEALRKVDRVLADESIPLATRRRVFARMVEAYGPELMNGQPAEAPADTAAMSG
jgi:hypothetical protein